MIELQQQNIALIREVSSIHSFFGVLNANLSQCPRCRSCQLSKQFPETPTEEKENDQDLDETLAEEEEWSALAEKLDEQAIFFVPTK